LILGLWKKKQEEGRILPEAIFQHPVKGESYCLNREEEGLRAGW
jgi:hypothetical protein